MNYQPNSLRIQSPEIGRESVQALGRTRVLSSKHVLLWHKELLYYDESKGRVKGLRSSSCWASSWVESPSSGIALDKEIVDTVFKWLHQAPFVLRVIFRGNGPASSKFIGIKAAQHYNACFHSKMKALSHYVITRLVI